MAMAKVTGASEAIRIDSDEGGRSPEGGPPKEIISRRVGDPHANGASAAIPECPAAEAGAPSHEGFSNRVGSSQSSSSTADGSRRSMPASTQPRGGGTSSGHHRAILAGDALARIMPHLQTSDPAPPKTAEPRVPSKGTAKPAAKQPPPLPDSLSNLPLDSGLESPVAIGRPGYLSARASPTTTSERNVDVPALQSLTTGSGEASRRDNGAVAFGSPSPPLQPSGPPARPAALSLDKTAPQPSANAQGQAGQHDGRKNSPQQQQQQQQQQQRSRHSRRRWSADLDCSNEGAAAPPSSIKGVVDPSLPPGLMSAAASEEAGGAQQQRAKPKQQQPKLRQEKAKAEPIVPPRKAMSEIGDDEPHQRDPHLPRSAASSPPSSATAIDSPTGPSEEETQQSESSIPVAKHLATDLERLLVQVIPMIGLGELGYTSQRKIANLTLDTVWEWFDEFSCYGREVYTLGGSRGPSISYYVPFLSAIRLFSPVYKETAAGSEEILMCDAQDVPPGFPVKMRLVYQFIETSAPKDRQPFCSKIESLFEGEGLESEGPSASGTWDPELVRNMRFQDIHPHSWFAVSWYPIYRIPDAPLKAAFLTYHTLAPIGVLLQPFHQQKMRSSGAGGSYAASASAPASPAPAPSSSGTDTPAAGTSPTETPASGSPPQSGQQRQPGSSSSAPGSPSAQAVQPPNPSLLLSLPVVGLEWYAMGDEAWCETHSAAKDTSPGTRLAESAWKAYISELRGTAGRLARSLGARGGRTLHHDYNFFNLRN